MIADWYYNCQMIINKVLIINDTTYHCPYFIKYMIYNGYKL